MTDPLGPYAAFPRYTLTFSGAEHQQVTVIPCWSLEVVKLLAFSALSSFPVDDVFDAVSIDLGEGDIRWPEGVWQRADDGSLVWTPDAD